MKRYIKINEKNEIIDLFHEHVVSKFDGTEIFLDEVEKQSVWIDGKVIFDETNNPIFKFINKEIIEIDTSVNLKEFRYNRNLEICISQRKSAYINESDGLFFDFQRGEIEKSVWIAKVEEIKTRFPKPME